MTKKLPYLLPVLALLTVIFSSGVRTEYLNARAEAGRLLAQYQSKRVDLVSQVAALQAGSKNVEVESNPVVPPVAAGPGHVHHLHLQLQPEAKSATVDLEAALPRVVKSPDAQKTAQLQGLHKETTQLAQKAMVASDNANEAAEEAAPGLNKATVGLVFSAILLVAALHVILSKAYKAEDLKWAYGTVGTILGHWLS